MISVKTDPSYRSSKKQKLPTDSDRYLWDRRTRFLQILLKTKVPTPLCEGITTGKKGKLPTQSTLANSPSSPANYPVRPTLPVSNRGALRRERGAYQIWHRKARNVNIYTVNNYYSPTNVFCRSHQHQLKISTDKVSKIILSTVTNSSTSLIQQWVRFLRLFII